MSNVAELLDRTAADYPRQMGIAMPLSGHSAGGRAYRSVTFEQLNEDCTQIARGLRHYGFRPGMRIVLMVRPSIDFITLVFALFRSGVVTVLIDPGMGRRNLIGCLQDVQPDGFVAIPVAQALRAILRRRFPKAVRNVTVGRRLFWNGLTLKHIREQGRSGEPLPDVAAQDPAAIIFTTGSTGPPKGVLYRHLNFLHQVTEIRDQYGIEPGEIDLPGFPLFGLFNAAMGVSTVIPDMDPTRPAFVNPRRIIEPIHQWQITQAFGSPALWNRVAGYCEQKNIRLPSLRRVLSAGAPVPPHVIRRLRAAISDQGEIHTPYGATEALPVATTSGRTILQETAPRSERGAGTCVGRRFPGMKWKVIQISDAPLASIEDTQPLAPGEIGELIVQGDVVTSQYVTCLEANAQHKIADGDGFWHRMGDVGYLDDDDRFWFCGRKTHRLQTEHGPLYTVPLESMMNRHPAVYRSALVGVGSPPRQRPVLIVECWPQQRPRSSARQRQLRRELYDLAQQDPRTALIEAIVFQRRLPVDIRHNSKIFREQLRKSLEGRELPDERPAFHAAEQ